MPVIATRELWFDGQRFAQGEKVPTERMSERLKTILENQRRVRDVPEAEARDARPDQPIRVARRRGRPRKHPKE